MRQQFRLLGQSLCGMALLTGVTLSDVALSDVTVNAGEVPVRSAGLAGEGPATIQFVQNGNDIGAAIIQGLIQGAAAAERDRQREEMQNQNFNNNNNQYYQDQQQYIPQQPAAPVAPPKPKPEAAGPFAVRSFQPNKLLAAPVFPPASLRNQLIKELDAVNLAQLETITEVMRSANISDLAVRKLVADAKKGAGAGLDAELLRDLQRAAAAKDATKVEELGAAMSLPDEALEVAVLATYVGELQKALENAVDPSDRRASLDVDKCVRRFQKQLRRSTSLSKELRDGIVEKLQSMVAVVEARQELGASAALARESGSQELTWPTGEVWVLATPEVKPGSVFYITSNLILAGTTVPGMANVIKSTVGSAIGCATFDNTVTVADRGAALAKPTRVTFLNPPSSGRNFQFQLNGYDYELVPGSMQHFKNSAQNKIETFRYAGADGNRNLGFNLVGRDGELITEAYFVLNWNGTGWTITNERTPPYISAILEPTTAPATALINDSDRALTVQFNGGSHLLQPGTSRSFDKVTNWRLEFNSGKGKTAYTLVSGTSFRFKNTDDGIAMFQAPASVVTIDNSTNALPFTYALGSTWHTAPAFQKMEHSFPVRPQSLTLAYDQGGGKLVSTTLQPASTYHVGLTQSMTFALSQDGDAATLPLDGQRRQLIEKEKKLIALAEELAEKRADEVATRTETPSRPMPGDDEAPVRPSTGKSNTTVNRPDTKTRTRLPAAHILAVGVSQYSNPEFNLKYADNDAREFASAFEKSAKDVFGSITSEVLVNKDATKLNIEKALDKITTQVDDADLVVLFFSAHGLSDDNRFYLCTHNVDPASLISTAVKYSDIVDAVHTLKGRDCRVLLLTDTCNSAALGAGLGKKALSDQSLFQAHKDYSTSGAGAVLLASSADGQASIERDEWEHGAFTKALLDTMADPESDVDEDGVLYLDEIVGAARRRLRKLTDNKQRLPVNWPSEIQDFPLMKSTTK